MNSEKIYVSSSPDYCIESIFWFHANSKYGKLLIGIYRDSLYDQSTSYYKNSILEIVKALGREEGLIQTIEEWLDVGLHLRPFTMQKRVDYYVTLTLDQIFIDKNHGKLIIALSNNVINLIPFPNEILKNNISIDTSLVDVDITLSNNTLSIQCTEEIKPGSILLIPESFSNYWYINVSHHKLLSESILCILNNDLRTVIIKSNKSQNTFKAIECVETSNNNTEYLSISIDNNIQLPLEILLGWKQDGQYFLSNALTNFTLAIKYNNKTIATGHLLSITNGYGVLIDTKLD